MPDQTVGSNRYAVVRPALDGYGTIEAPALATMTERHRFKLPVVTFRAADVADLPPRGQRVHGAILVLEQGLPSRAHLRLLARLQSRGLITLLAWPHEEAVEVVDRERLASLRRHWLAAVVGQRLKAWRANRHATSTGAPSQADVQAGPADIDVMRALAGLMRGEADSLHGHIAGGVAALRGSKTQEAIALAEHFAAGLTALERMRTQVLQLEEQVAKLNGARTVMPQRQSAPAAGHYDEGSLPEVRAFLQPLREAPRPVEFPLGETPEPGRPLSGTGMYLRLDFWAPPLTAGGSYGHTCYQARALARTCSDFVCVVANRFDLLDKLGVRQVIVPGRDGVQTEANLLGMNAHYVQRLGPLFDAMRPAFIFERIVLGNVVGAWASRQFRIPYVVEYNGSEISIKRSFEGKGYAYEDLLLAAEEAAFRQATLISVVSERVAEDVARRGIPRAKILVNPNAVDLQSYAPASGEEKGRLRAALGFAPQDRVVGFIGTFGGWHGIEVLAEALPTIVGGDERAKVLLIGDGHLKHLVRDAVAAAGIQNRVVDVGRVPQERGAELLKACDVLVSPHSRNMIDSPFFGSPTKLFEYMAMGTGIVASDLEQIGQVLSPALTSAEIAAAHAAGRRVDAGERRAVLCRPGDVADFAQAVLSLVRDADLCSALGRNARAAAECHHTWDRHVQNLWRALAGHWVAADRQGER